LSLPSANFMKAVARVVPRFAGSEWKTGKETGKEMAPLERRGRHRKRAEAELSGEITQPTYE